MRDPYSILGVRRNAGQDEIKSAWRSVAKALHPDQNQDDPLATQRFAEASRAYEILKDPQMRARYDDARRDANLRYMEQMSQQRRRAAGGAQPAEAFVDEESAEEVISRIFGTDQRSKGGPAGPAPAQPAASSQTARPAPEAPAQPASKPEPKPEPKQEAAEAAQAAAAPARGTAPAGDLVSAIVRRIRNIANKTPDKVIERAPDLTFDLFVTVADIFNRARVKADLPEDQSFNIRLPAGTTTGQEIRLKEQGHRVPGLKRGDAVATVRLAPDETIRVEGYDLRVVLPVDIGNAILGCDSSVDTPEGKIAVTVPPWSGSDHVIRIENQGLADADGKRGDLLVEIRVMLWDKPDSKVTDLMRSLREGLFL
ncbi:DnaJ C-terminal domain-containing protein [Pararhizobium sp.]|uniref:DnaJ C-terminal domain-containing protein n=1 Tax=Pararhizobium sp. TaxID=1977563 RepID=UPI00271A01F8|nr:DnaJ C-terminal domain-containing protein [Pararhizobium sp.]MDO9415753.1 DnaJ C-terminal domain-containing protein [Pararhizobium sp.]